MLTRSATPSSLVNNGVGPYPSYASDSANRFVPEVWSALMLRKFYPACVLADIANTDYEGEISGYGDKIIIRTSPDIVVEPYEVGMNLNYQVPDSVSSELVIDKGFSFAIAIESTDKYQSDLNLLEDFTETAGIKIAVETDTLILAGDGVTPGIFTDADAANQGATAGAISGNIDLGVAGIPVVADNVTKSVVDHIVDLGCVLDEQNIPSEDRFVILPSKGVARIKTSELKDASLAGDGTSILRNGLVGMIDRFKVYQSNLLNVSAAGEFDVIAGHKSALSFAAQIVDDKLVTMLNPHQHGELIRGLTVFGYKVLQPTALVWSVMTF